MKSSVFSRILSRAKTRKVYLLCGVSGAGKSWVCKQLTDKFDYVPHDDYIGKDSEYLDKLTEEGNGKAALTECPFGERSLREKIEGRGSKVIPVFVIEHPSVVSSRYRQREKKDLRQAVLTRAETIKDRAKEWKAHSGTSADILEYLKKLQV